MAWISPAQHPPLNFGQTSSSSSGALLKHDDTEWFLEDEEEEGQKKKEKKFNKKQAMIKEEMRTIENQIHEVMSVYSSDMATRDEKLSALFAQREKVGKKLRTMQLNQSRQRRFRERKRQQLKASGALVSVRSQRRSLGKIKLEGSDEEGEEASTKKQKMSRKVSIEDLSPSNPSGDDSYDFPNLPEIMEQSRSSMQSFATSSSEHARSGPSQAIIAQAAAFSTFEARAAEQSLVSPLHNGLPITPASENSDLESLWRHATEECSRPSSLSTSTTNSPGSQLKPVELVWDQLSLSQLVSEQEIEFLKLFNTWKNTKGVTAQGEEEIAVKLLRLRKAYLSDKEKYGAAAARTFAYLQAQRNTSLNEAEKKLMSSNFK